MNALSYINVSNYKIPTLLCDFYKISHMPMYPENTTVVYSTWTHRASRIAGVEHGVSFGFQQFFKKYLIDFFNAHFFARPVEDAVAEYERFIKYTLGIEKPHSDHIRALHNLGYLPLSIRIAPEGTVLPLRVPMMTVHNTHPDFFWVTNYIETLASCELWQAPTSATIARRYKKLLDSYATETVGNTDFVPFQGHDFSMRGMSSLDSAISSGMGHLLSFVGTDTIPAISAAEAFYNANIEKELIGTSIPATEHSIQCAYGDDYEYFDKLITKVHPSGFVSIVSDGYDFWGVLKTVLPQLKDKIMARDGKVVIRPDSGDPVKIVCGDPDAPKGSAEHMGAVEVLWNIFGGTVSDKGYRVLDSHIGLIYGDAITLRRCEEICERLKEKRFASINCVFGIGSYTYQYNTRDSLGFALKSTLCVINGVEKHIFKDPKTDDGTKRSQKGRVVVVKKDGQYSYIDCLGLNDHVSSDILVEAFRDGKLLVDESFSVIRKRLQEHSGY